jgi:hypothetical protein
MPRLLPLVTELKNKNALSFADAKSMTDIGRKLLQSVGLEDPDQIDQAAIDRQSRLITNLCSA